MQLRHIALASLNRRKGRFAFLLLALTLGIGTVIALLSLSTAMRTAVGDELDRFGANIIGTPRSRALDLAYGGIDIGGGIMDLFENLRATGLTVFMVTHDAAIASYADRVVTLRDGLVVPSFHTSAADGAVML